MFEITVCTQDISHQDQIGQKAEAKSSNSQLDPDENWQHHQVRKIQCLFLLKMTERSESNLDSSLNSFG